MALIQCTECGHQISDKAVACPSCGAPAAPAVEQQPNPQLEPAAKRGVPIGWIVVVGAVLFILIAAGLGSISPTNPAAGPAASSGATDTVRATPEGKFETVALTRITDAAVIDSARLQVADAGYKCISANTLWVVSFTAKIAIKVLKVACSDGNFQITIFDNKAFVKPWTGTLMGD